MMVLLMQVCGDVGTWAWSVGKPRFGEGECVAVIEKRMRWKT